jgi:hypothetical protein
MKKPDVVAAYATDKPIHLAVDERERDTIIAALRFWQREMIRGPGFDVALIDIATNGRKGRNAALTAREIDELIEERINA